MWLIGATVCLLAATWIQLSVNAGNGWPHNALRHNWLMPISCHFRDCKALLVTSLTHVSGAIASAQTFIFTFYLFIGLRVHAGMEWTCPPCCRVHFHNTNTDRPTYIDSPTPRASPCWHGTDNRTTGHGENIMLQLQTTHNDDDDDGELLALNVIATIMKIICKRVTIFTIGRSIKLLVYVLQFICCYVPSY